VKDLGKLFIYLLATVLLGALMAPALFWGAHLVAAQSGDGVIAQFVAKTDFQRFFNRAVLIAALLLLIPLIRAIRIPDRAALGLEPDTAPWRHWFTGFIIAFLSMVLMAGLALWLGPYKLRGTIPWDKMMLLPLTAIAASVVEEYLFRGGIQGVAQRTLTNWMAIFFVSALFAIIHFLKPPETGIAMADVHWFSGFNLLTRTFWQFGDPKLLLWGFSTMFLVGAVLGYARLRTRSLWMPIGLHAGWVLSKMSFSVMTRRSGAEATWPWFGSDILVGLVPVLTLIATGWAVWWWLNHADKNRYRRW
jgi:membrane protease YdiL (CAAX protease family)